MGTQPKKEKDYQNNMKVLISIDDTDDIESRGTGEIAELLSEGIVRMGWGKCGPVTRHQLLVHPDIPYTSHNSSMCFPAEIPETMLDAVIDYCSSALKEESAPSSDPGLCVMVPERVSCPDALIDYGRKAKTAVISKDEAYQTAAVHNVHLSEHGGTGQGVIGALAGAGLRLTGNDGRFKGKFRIPSRDGSVTVGEIRTYGVDAVQTVEGEVLDEDVTVHVGEWVKLVLINGRSVLLAVPGDSPARPWRAVDKKIFRNY
jgi:hypothetical protein